MDHPQLTHQGSRAKKFSWVKKLMNNTNNNKVSTNTSSIPTAITTATTTVTPALKVSKSATPISKTFHFSDITSLENDQISYVSTTASNYSSTFRQHEMQQRLFYTRNHLVDDNSDFHSNIPNDIETNSSIKSLYSANFPASIYSNNTTKYSKNIVQPQNLVSINSQLYHHMNNNYSSSTGTYNASMINNVDLTSTLSDSIMDDNISTKPILSISSDEEEEEEEEEEEDDDNDDSDNDNDNDNSRLDDVKSIKFQYDDYALPTDDKYDNDNEIDDDDISFDIRSRYPPSHGSTAVTSMSVLTSPLLTTINSQTTTQTNTNATVASVMTLASSSRNVAI